MTTLTQLPDFSGSKYKKKIDDLRRLMVLDLTASQYINGRGAARLFATLLKAYRASIDDDKWSTKPFLKQSIEEKRRFNLVLAAIFDFVSNIEYCHARLVNSDWIYCNRPDTPLPRVYYAFLKQCPRCCLDIGLGSRISGAQHKPSSHHIGEITTTLSALTLSLLGSSAPKPVKIAVISKQSHDVDAIAFRDDLLVLFEIKASPMVTFPLCFDLSASLKQEKNGEVTDYPQHSLVDVQIEHEKLNLFIPHRNWMIPLAGSGEASWPYEPAIRFFSHSPNFLDYLDAWLEIFYAYAVPKSLRKGREIILGYLANGWGDEIDSNKTKPGLGRTDDIKKGTYQMLKFGAYYNDDDFSIPVKSVLVANLDPLFLRADYLDKLIDVRWAKKERFIEEGTDQSKLWIESRYLHDLYEAIVAFNAPLINDQTLADVFDFAATDKALLDGKLDALLLEWSGV
ncbi:MAG: hypothetical protein WBP93_23865 [Pyrinomonadaceae bacterium]